ncbi:MAG: PrsW family glutamic-type intramembrane protease [Candidatus Edwardsbacteria bacterium]
MGIYLSAGIATVLSIVLSGYLISLWDKSFKKYLLLVFLLLPFSPFVNILVKKPLTLMLERLFQISEKAKPWWFLLIDLFIAPITEELFKVLPIIVFPLRQWVRDYRSVLCIGLAVGLGFGLGEMWLIAWRIHIAKPEIANLAFYKLGGFIGERALCCFVHGILTSLVLKGLLGSFKDILSGYLKAVSLHALLNTSALLYQEKILPVGGTLFIAVPMILIMLHILLKFEEKVRQERRKSV